MASLATSQVRIDVADDVQIEPGGHSFDESGECLAVRFTGRMEGQSGHRSWGENTQKPGKCRASPGIPGRVHNVSGHRRTRLLPQFVETIAIFTESLAIAPAPSVARTFTYTSPAT